MDTHTQVNQVDQINPLNPLNQLNTYTFSTKTQYDKTLDYLYKDYVTAKRGVSGPVFAVVTANEYLKFSNLTKEKHEMNVNRAVMISSVLSLRENIFLETILKDTDISPTLIVNTKVDILLTSNPTLSNMIPDINHNGRFCTIIHKNKKFFVVIGDANINRYCVRDCNEPCQYNFTNRADLINYLSDIYYLNKEFVVDGLIVPGYSSIEYIVLKHSFKDIFDQQVERVILQGINNANVDHINIPNRVPNQHVQHVQPIRPLINQNQRRQVNEGSAFIGYVNNVPNDNIDMMALQRQFGEGNIADVMNASNNIHNRHNIHNIHNIHLSDDDDNNNYHQPKQNRGFARMIIESDSDEDENEYEDDSDEDNFFNDD